MATGSPETGASSAPVVEQDPVVNTTNGQYTFSKSGGPVLVDNPDADTDILVKINADTASAAIYDVRVRAGRTVDVSFDGEIRVKSLSIWFPTGSVTTGFTIAANNRVVAWL